MEKEIKIDKAKRSKGNDLNESYKKAPEKIKPPLPKPPPSPPPKPPGPKKSEN